MNQHFGSVQAYFTKGLGLSAATASALRHQLLEGARADRYGAGSRTPGLQMPAGSRARLSALKASSSAGLRLSANHDRFWAPMPCSAEMLPRARPHG